MHTQGRDSFLLPLRLRLQAGAVRSLPREDDLRLLLPQAGAVHTLVLPARLLRRLLPQTGSVLLLAG